VKGIVLLTSEHTRFPVKVTFVTEYNAAGVGKLRSYTYCITLNPGVNIISWCTDSGFAYDPFPKPSLLFQNRPSHTLLLFPNFLDGMRKTYVLSSEFPFPYIPLSDMENDLPHSEQPIPIKMTTMFNIESEWVGSPSCVTLLANKGRPSSLWALAKLAMGGDGFNHAAFSSSSLSLPSHLFEHRFISILNTPVDFPPRVPHIPPVTPPLSDDEFA
jgi:hypothetical protein